MSWNYIVNMRTALYSYLQLDMLEDYASKTKNDKTCLRVIKQSH